MNKNTKYVIEDIQWENERGEIILPSSLDVADELINNGNIDYNEVSKWLSDKYGFSVKSFSIHFIDSYSECPYCQIKEIAATKTIFEALNPVDGRCSCGAAIDKGQYKVKVNGYTDIFKGAIKLLSDMVGEFEKILAYADIDIRDYIDNECNEGPMIRMNTSDIIDRLFLPYYGGTTIANFKEAIGVVEDRFEWEIGVEEEE